MSNISFDISIEPTVNNEKYFVFNGNQYLFNFELFKNNSDFFLTNQEQYKNVKYIQLFDPNEAKKFDDIPDSAITNFISLCQNQKCKINNSDIFYIQYLSHKYQVTNLLQTITDLISSNKKILEFESILFKYLHEHPADNINNIFSEEESIIISTKLIEYINDDRLFKLPISILYQILLKYFERRSQNNDHYLQQIEENTIINFLFQCLDKYGSDASYLFTLIQLNNDIIDRITSKYSKVFDFNLINSNLLDYVKDKINKSDPLKKSNDYNDNQDDYYDDKDDKMTDLNIQLKINKNEAFFGSNQELKFSQNTRIKNVVIPSTFKSIGLYMFFKCSSLTQVVIPLTVKTIDDYAFAECSSLKYIKIPTSIRLIGNYSFLKCTSLTKISIPSSVGCIGCEAFGGCNKIKEIIIDPYKTIFEENTFVGCNLLSHFIFGPSTRTIKQFNLIYLEKSLM